MNALHTRGPWDFAGVAHDEDGEPAFFSIMAGRIEVANTASGDVTTTVEQANARLIAAAPGLLEAAQTALSFINGGLNVNADTGNGLVYARLRDSVAKAIGSDA